MDWVRDILYFEMYKYSENEIAFKPIEIISNIYFDKTQNIIPYTNGECYLVFQDITFKIIEFIEENNYNHLVVRINNDNDNDNIPEIIIIDNTLDSSSSVNDNIINEINLIMTEYINSKFSLFVNQK